MEADIISVAVCSVQMSNFVRLWNMGKCFYLNFSHLVRRKFLFFLFILYNWSVLQRSWMHGLRLPKDCQSLVLTQKEELQIT